MIIKQCDDIIIYYINMYKIKCDKLHTSAVVRIPILVKYVHIIR